MKIDINNIKLMSSKKNLVSLFSGCGGMDIGFEGGFKIPKNLLNKQIHTKWIEKEDDLYIYLKDTIFETKFANDISFKAKIAWSNYFTKKKGFNVEDIFKVGSIVDIVKEHRKNITNVFPANVEVVIGGFPCQDFSIAGKRNGFNSHRNHIGETIDFNIPTEETRGKLYMWMKEVIEITLPKIFIAENVKGLINLGDIKNIIQEDFSSIGDDGYLVLSPKILHSGEYGIPQTRERIFFIGFKKSALSKKALIELSKNEILDEYSPYPEATHKLQNTLLNSQINCKLENFIPSREVLIDLKEPEHATDISQMYYSKAKFMGKHCQGQKEVNLNRLAPTIRAEHHGNIEFRRLSLENGGTKIEELAKGHIERRLTVRECARIQTFPDDFDFVIPKNNTKTKFHISPSSGYKLVGNAVPPLLAYHISKKIESNWNFYFGVNHE